MPTPTAPSLLVDALKAVRAGSRWTSLVRLFQRKGTSVERGWSRQENISDYCTANKCVFPCLFSGRASQIDMRKSPILAMSERMAQGLNVLVSSPPTPIFLEPIKTKSLRSIPNRPVPEWDSTAFARMQLSGANFVNVSPPTAASPNYTSPRLEEYVSVCLGGGKGSRRGKTHHHYWHPSYGYPMESLSSSFRAEEMRYFFT